MPFIKQLARLSTFLFGFLCVCFLASVLAVSGQTVNKGDVKKEVWELTITGDTKARCKMFLVQSNIEKDKYFVSGNFAGKIHDDRWGAGRIRCTLKGKTGKSVFVADLRGQADMEEGEAAGVYFISGKAKGTLSKAQGFGTWYVEHEFGSPRGEWTAKRIE